MAKYELENNCGKFYAVIENNEKGYDIQTGLNQKGNCSDYKIVGNVASNAINTFGKNPEDFAETIKKLSCSKGSKSCMNSLGNCLEKHLNNFK